MVQKIKCGKEEGDKFVSYCREWNGFFQPTVGRVGGLGLLRKLASIGVECLKRGRNYLSCLVHNKCKNFDFKLWNVYGPTQSEEKMNLWEEIYQSLLASINKKIIMGGDFNAILDLMEKNGGASKITKDMLDFRDFVQRIEAIDCKPTKGWFTWNNRRKGFSNILEHLDIFLINNYWMKEGIQISSKILPFSISDHYLV
ncbi:hypothetical protein SUGI_0635780 [Cryptomeria japonica]|nr:hypothetical protein SUGI_0635780 [Cryptomeria japonica]